MAQPHPPSLGRGWSSAPPWLDGRGVTFPTLVLPVWSSLGAPSLLMLLVWRVQHYGIGTNPVVSNKRDFTFWGAWRLCVPGYVTSGWELGTPITYPGYTHLSCVAARGCRSSPQCLWGGRPAGPGSGDTSPSAAGTAVSRLSTPSHSHSTPTTPLQTTITIAT